MYLTNEDQDNLLYDIVDLFKKQNYNCPNTSRLRNKIRIVKSIIIDKTDNIIYMQLSIMSSERNIQNYLIMMKI